MAPVVHTKPTTDRASIQPMPPLTDEQLAALRDDIAENGVLVPITVDQNGRIIDGNNRAAIAAELFLECPEVAVEVADDEAAHDLALSLNCARRHLNQEQRRELIRTELDRRPGETDRAIARRIGCSPTTVGTVRRGGVSNLDSQSAEARAAEIDDSLAELRVRVFAVASVAVSGGCSVAEVVLALTKARQSLQRHFPESPLEVRSVFETAVFDFVIEVVMWKDSLAEMQVMATRVGVRPLNESGQAALLADLANIIAPTDAS